MDFDDEDDLGFETSAQELEQILPKAVFHRLSPVAGGHWRVYRRGPNDYQAVYSMRSDGHAFAVSSHSMSTVVSLSEVYDTFPVHRSRSLNNNQTQRILPQIERVLQPENSNGPSASGQNTLTPAFQGGVLQDGAPINVAMVSQQNLIINRDPPAPHGIMQLSLPYHDDQLVHQDPANNSFMSIPHHNGLSQSNISESFFTQDAGTTAISQDTAPNDDEVSIGSATDDDAEESRDGMSDGFTSVYAIHGNIGINSQPANHSTSEHSNLAQPSWVDHAEQSTPDTHNAQITSTHSDGHLVLDDFYGGPMEFFHHLEGFMIDDQMNLASQTMADVPFESTQLQSLNATPHSEISSMHFSAGMAMFGDSNVSGGEDMRFDAV